MHRLLAGIVQLVSIPAVLAGTMFLLGLALFTHDNGFPYQYHPDEHSKVRQILTGERNLRHPLLLLNTTDLAVRMTSGPRTEQSVAVIGRCVAAAFAAGAVAALALLGRAVAGTGAGWLAGALALTNPQIYECAHYFKEDTALLLGCAVTWLFVMRFLQQRTDWNAVGIGLGLALAASGKYLGLVNSLLVITALVVSFRRDPLRIAMRRTLLVIASAAAIFLAINHQLVSAPEQLLHSLDFEMKHIVEGESGIARRVPHAFYFGRMLEVLTPAILVGGLGFLVYVLMRRRDLWPVALFPLVYLAALSCSPKVALRYFLPVTAAGCVFAAAGACLFFQQSRRSPRLRRSLLVLAAAGAFTGALLLSQVAPLRTMIRSFTKDSRLELTDWILANVPAGTKLAYETKVGLEWLTERVPRLQDYQLLRKDYVADLGTVDELRERGIRYVAVYGVTRSFHRGAQQFPQPSVRQAFERRRDFYAQLDDSTHLVWKRKQGPAGYTLPGLRLYDLHATAQ